MPKMTTEQAQSVLNDLNKINTLLSEYAKMDENIKWKLHSDQGLDLPSIAGIKKMQRDFHQLTTLHQKHFQAADGVSTLIYDLQDSPPELQISIRNFSSLNKKLDAVIYSKQQKPWERNDFETLKKKLEQEAQVKVNQEAEQLRQISWLAFSQLNESDFRNTKGLSEMDKASKAYLEVANSFNNISYHVANSILSGATIDQRTQLVDHYIAVMKKSMELNDLNTAFAISAALQHTAIRSLKNTFSHLPETSKNLIKQVTQLSSNYSLCYNAIQERKQPLLPFYGTFRSVLEFSKDNPEKFNAIVDQLKMIKAEYQAAHPTPTASSLTDLQKDLLNEKLDIDTLTTKAKNLKEEENQLTSSYMIDSVITDPIIHFDAGIKNFLDERARKKQEKEAVEEDIIQATNQALGTLKSLTTYANKINNADALDIARKQALHDILNKLKTDAPMNATDNTGRLTQDALQKRIEFLTAAINTKSVLHQHHKVTLKKGKETNAIWFLKELKATQENLLIQQKKLDLVDKPKAELIFDHEPTKLELGEKLSRDMLDYTWVKPKSGGANSPGKLGGLYSIKYGIAKSDGALEEKKQIILFKQDTKGNRVLNGKNISEVVAGEIMNELIGDSAASVFFAKAPGTVKLPDETGENVYVGSIYYDNYKDLFVELYAKKGLDVPSDRPKGVGILSERTNVLRTGMLNPDTNRCFYDDFSKVTAASALVGDFDVHWGNYGVVTNNTGEKRLVKIDHGGALAELEDDLHIHSHTKHIPLTMRQGRLTTQPTNHFREYPRPLRINPDFVSQLEVIANHDPIKMRERIQKVMNNVSTYYGLKPIMEFAEHIGLKPEEIAPKNWGTLNEDKKAQLKNLLLDKINAHLIQKITARQQSAKQLATDIKMSLCIKEVTGKFQLDNTHYKLDDVIKQNPLYFLKGDYHFRKKDQRSQLGPIRTKIFKASQLKALVDKELDKNLDEIIRDAIYHCDPSIIEHVFANHRLRHQLSTQQPGRFAALKEAYHDILGHMSDDLTKISGQSFIAEEPGKVKEKSMISIVSNLIADELLAERSLPHRAMIGERWVALMGKAYENNDFQTAFAIYSGLHDPAILQLTQTFKGLSERAKQIKMNIEAQFENEKTKIFDPSKAAALTEEKLSKNEFIIPIPYLETVRPEISNKLLLQQDHQRNILMQPSSSRYASTLPKKIFDEYENPAKKTGDLEQQTKLTIAKSLETKGSLTPDVLREKKTADFTISMTQPVFAPSTLQKEFILDKKDLYQSKNRYIQVNAGINFIYSKDEHDGNLFSQIRKDALLRDTLINGKKLRGDAYPTDEDLKERLKQEFPEKWELLLQHYSQQPSYLFTQAFQPSDGMNADVIVKQPQGPEVSRKNIFQGADGEIYFTTWAKSFEKVDDSNKLLGIIPGPIESLFKLTKAGFELIQIKTPNPELTEFLMGKKELRDLSTLNAEIPAQKPKEEVVPEVLNPKATEPAKATPSFIKELPKKLQDVFNSLTKSTAVKEVKTPLLTASDLKNSGNAFIANAALAKNFNCSAPKGSDIIGSLRQLVGQQIKLNGKTFTQDQLQNLNDDQFKTLLTGEFSTKTEMLLNHFNMQPALLVPLALKPQNYSQATVFIKQPDPHRVEKNIYRDKSGDLYFQVMTHEFKKFNNKNELLGIIPGPIETLFKLTKEGFQLVHIKSQNEELLRCLQGKVAYHDLAVTNAPNLAQAPAKEVFASNSFIQNHTNALMQANKPAQPPLKRSLSAPAVQIENETTPPTKPGRR